MKKLIFTIGISASGKTTWAEKYVDENENTALICRDDIRGEYFCGGEIDRIVSDIQEERILEAIGNGQDILIADTNLNKDHINRIIKLVRDEDSSYEPLYQWFDIDVMEAIKRDTRRSNSVGSQVIFSQYEKYCLLREHRLDIELFQNAYKDLPKAIIVDLDGTTADMRGIRKPFEWEKVGEDLPHEEVIEMVVALANKKGYHVFFFSGRDGACREDSLKWINKHISCDLEVPWTFDMRDENNSEKDWIIKDHLFQKHCEGKYNVVLAFDDRPQMIRHWWFKRGIKTIACANPYLEF